MYTCTVVLTTLIFSCRSVHNIVDDILTLVHKFEFKTYERDAGISSLVLEFGNEVFQRPIEFKVGGFYCLNQPLLATVSTNDYTLVNDKV